MEAKKCDRCGKLYEYTRVVILFEKYDGSDSVILRRCDIDGNERSATEWDLCPECRADFENWIKAGGIAEITPAETAAKEETPEAEAQPVRAGEYWQNNATGEIVKIEGVDNIEVQYKTVTSGVWYREGVDYFKKTYTKKGGAE